MNRDLREVFVELDDLVAQESTTITLDRLRDTFDSARRFSEWFVPAQTVCNYWNYWFTFLPEALSDRDQVGYNFRQALTNAPRGPSSSSPSGRQPSIFRARRMARSRATRASRRPVSMERSRIPHKTASSPPRSSRSSTATRTAPLARTDSDCQAGQTGYLLGDLRLPGQPASNPTVAVKDIPGDRGITTLFFDDAGNRTYRDTRVESRQP